MRHRLRSSYVGAIAIAMLLTAGVNGIIKAAEPPISKAIVLVVNDMGQKHVRSFLSLSVPQVYSSFVLLNAAAGLVYALFALALAAWLYRDQLQD